MNSTLTAIAQVLGLIVAPVLLFLQNERSSRREDDNRREERKASERREERTLEQQQHAAAEESAARARRDELDRYLDFLRAVTEVTNSLHSAAASGAIYTMSDETALRLAQAFEGARIDAPDTVATTLDQALSVLRRLIERITADSTHSDADIRNYTDREVGAAREAIRRHLAERGVIDLPRDEAPPPSA